MVHMAAGGYNTAAAHLHKAFLVNPRLLHKQQGSRKPPPAQTWIRLPGETTTSGRSPRYIPELIAIMAILYQQPMTQAGWY